MTGGSPYPGSSIDCHVSCRERTRSVSDMGERFSHRRCDSVIRPLGMLLAYECLFEATHGPVQIARRAPTLAGRHFPKSRDLSLSSLGNVVHPSKGIVFSRGGRGCLSR